MGELRFVDAAEEAHFAAMSLIHAQGWRAAYPGYVPQKFLDEEITDGRWIETFRENWRTGRAHSYLLCDGERPVCCATYGPARTEAGIQSGSPCRFQNAAYAGWGEIISFYTLPSETGKGYGSILMEETLRRLRADGFQDCYLYVLRENEGARRFYARHGFAWDGTWEEIPFPPDAVCIDLRYVRRL